MEEFRLVAEGLRAHGRGQDGLVVLVTDDQGSGRARTFLAYQIGRLLGEGGARVLLVDGEFAEDGPGEWLGEPGHEGLLDIARYGASPRACLQRTILPNTELMSLGSFRPGEDEALVPEEIQACFRQLRSGWDFVLCTAPAYYSDGSFNPLFHHGDGVLMGVTLKGEARDRFESLADYLLEEGINVFGVMAFSEPGHIAEAAEPEPLAVEDPPSRATSPYADLHRRSAHQSSSIFRNVAVGIVVALVVFVGLWFGIQWLQRPETLEPVSLTQEHRIQNEAREANPPDGELQLAGGGTQANSTPMDDEEGVEGEGPGADAEITPSPVAESGTVVPAREEQDEEVVEQEDAEGQPETRTGSQPAAGTPPPDQAVRSAPDREESEVLPEPAKVVPEPAAETPATTDPLEIALRLHPSSGYALHLWSFPDSMQAIPSVRKLESEGFQPLVVAAEVKGKGLWYRVLVGNYATRAEALDARQLLSDRPDIDYVGVLKVGR